MRKILITILGLISISVSAQKIGVNTVTPQYLLDIRSTALEEPGQLNIGNMDNSRYIRLFCGSDVFPDPSLLWQPGMNFLFASYDDATFTFTEYMRINTLGKVGIGIVDPEAQLDLKGGDWNLGAGNPGDLRIGNSSHNFRIGVETGGGGAGISRLYSSSELILGSANQEQVKIDSEGETGFGTSSPSQKVHINGKLKIGDDAKAPTEGTIRYNSSNQSFEGYDGTRWVKLGGSSPFGHTGSFNLPDTSYHFDVSGEEVVGIQVNGNLVAIRSRLPIPSTIPNVFTYKIYIDLFEQEITNGSWVHHLILSSSSKDSDANNGNAFLLVDGFLLIGDPKNKNVMKYEYNGIFWQSTHTFDSPISSIEDFFGWSLDHSQGITIIGAPEININTLTIPIINGPGHAYIYDEMNVLEASLSGTAPADGDGFGFSVGIGQNRAVIGTPFKHFGSTEDAGSFTIMNYFNGSWSTNSTRYNSTVEANEHYGTSVSVEGSDYLYVQGDIEGLDLYVVENGFWTLKETISGSGQAPQIKNFLTQNFSDLLFLNDPGLDKTPFISLKARMNNNLFEDVSFLINGTASIASYDITGDKIYTISDDGQVFEFRR